MCAKVMEESSISRNISHQMEDIECVTTVPGTHSCFVEDCSDPMHMDTEDDHSCTGSSKGLQHSLCEEKAEYDCEEQLEKPQADNVFDSVVGDEKCQPEEVSNVKTTRNPSETCIDFTRSKKTWRGYYCCVPLCRNSSGQNADREMLGLPKVSFHSLPELHTVKGKTWIARIRRDPGSKFLVNKYTKIYSQHFTSDDFVSLPECPLVRPHLKPTAVPSVFPWSTEKFKRETLTSKKVSSAIQFRNYRNDGIHSISERGSESNCVYTDDEPAYSDSAEHVDSLQSHSILNELEVLRQKVSQLQADLDLAKESTSKSLFRLKNIEENDELIKFYTGFPDYATLLAFYEKLLEADAAVMRQWAGKNCKNEYEENKRGRPCKLPLLEQFFLTLVRLRLGLFELDLANRFEISQATVSRITATWINLLYHTLKGIERFPPWHIVKKYMPETFKKEYPNTRVIIDATEFYVDRPSSLLSQACTFSAYKNKNTVKVLIGITPSGTISFVSKCYEGSISDRKLVELSGLLEKLEPGDQIMADKGFQIQDLLTPLGVRLNVPPFLTGGAQMSASDVIITKKIAHLRVHVERAIERVKEFHILKNTLPATMWDSINEVVYVCCMLTNFNPPLVS